ncbi:transposase [Streptomyces mirabilis]|nr:transposase [Streptomyces mirabilis]
MWPCCGTRAGYSDRSPPRPPPGGCSPTPTGQYSLRCERPAPHFGFHPLQCFRANIGEVMSGRLRPGNSGANTADHHIAVLDDALAQISYAHRYGTQILVRADCAGSAKAFLTHFRTLREHGLNLRFSIGYAVTEPVGRAVGRHPHHRAARTTAPWRPTVPVDHDEGLRHQVFLTGTPYPSPRPPNS